MSGCSRRFFLGRRLLETILEFEYLGLSFSFQAILRSDINDDFTNLDRYQVEKWFVFMRDCSLFHSIWRAKISLTRIWRVRKTLGVVALRWKHIRSLYSGKIATCNKRLMNNQHLFYNLMPSEDPCSLRMPTHVPSYLHYPHDFLTQEFYFIFQILILFIQ